MKCKNIIRKLSAFQDNELPVKDRTHIKDHLKDCSACRSEFHSLIQIKKDFARAPELSPARSMAPEIMERIYQLPSPKPLSKLLNVGIYSLTALLLILMVFVLNFQFLRSNETKFDNLLDNNSILSMVSEKEDTSVLNISEDIFDSILSNGAKNEE